MTALLRSRRSAARLAALAVAVVGAVLLLLAIARTTVWASSPVTVVHVKGQTGVPVVDTTPEALALDGPSIRVDVRAADSTAPVFVGVGRAADVEAYLGAAARTEITGVRGGNAAIRKVGTDSTLPAPAGVDVWALAVTGKGSAGLQWPQAAGRWRVVAAVDGAAAPSEVVLAWQRARASSSVPALFAVGGLLLVLGLVGVRASRTRTASVPSPATDAVTHAPAPPAGPVHPPAPGRPPAVSVSPARQVDVSDPGAVHEDDDEPEDAPAPAPFRQERRS